MTIDERLGQAMRAAANSVEPPVADLVSGGVARGRRQRRRRVAATTGGVLTAAAVLAGGAIALPDMLSTPDVVADPAVDDAPDGTDVGAAPGLTAEKTPLVIEEPSLEVSEDQLDALVEDVAALAGGTIEHRDLVNPAWPQLRLDFGDLGAGEVNVTGFAMPEAMDDWCSGGQTCKVLVDSDAAVVWHQETSRGDVLAYQTRSGRMTDLMVRAGTVEVPEGTTTADLGFGDAHALRDAVLAAVPDAESPDRGEFTADELDDIAVAVAELSSASSGEFVAPHDTTIAGRVLLDGVDAFDVRASFDQQGNDRAVWSESCERGEGDGKPCTELLNTGEFGVFASTYPYQSGRESLRYVADLDDGTLIITIDNYIETPGNKTVGVSWQDAGIDPDELVVLVEASGVLAD